MELGVQLHQHEEKFESKFKKETTNGNPVRLLDGPSITCAQHYQANLTTNVALQTLITISWKTLTLRTCAWMTAVARQCRGGPYSQ
eukprot:5665736-Pyramimonas_sp.AAC.1